jgi:tRNA(Ile)-lysidine synthase TilS/MesJ
MNQLLNEEEKQRWEDIKATFKKNNQFKEGLFAIKEEIQKGVGK